MSINLCLLRKNLIDLLISNQFLGLKHFSGITAEFSTHHGSPTKFKILAGEDIQWHIYLGNCLLFKMLKVIVWSLKSP